ncbi:hypothetical protein SAMN05444274_102160 [Mariniphaga anaerophila]|uniref:Secreted protein n=1 Tax=Mariniphaga anaerophila TaxID=1484053 RepID=A0A1M4VP78_9BACT|nr:hypothetical protein [Mariniphaga anaerophila]SHE70685.1 hypothetical protein SAMN05444274_102160 [Mariniphaga anaerophila]
MKQKLIFSIVALFCAFTSQAQSVTTMWPYIYPDFQEGTVYFKDHKSLQAPLNVHLVKSTLHYLEKDKIKEADSGDIESVHIGRTQYYVSDKQLMHVISGDSTKFLAELVVADFSAAKESGGAYGSSSNVQATRKVTSMDIGGVSIVNHMELKEKKDAGTLLPLTRKYFIVANGKEYPATRKGIESQLEPNQKAAFKQFVKQNKIKWKQPDSLVLLLNFFKNH